MKQKIQISIPEPCHEGWQNMTPVEKGRFCAFCQKTVLDFTYLSDNEIIKLISKNDNLCGRINVSQLNRNLIETKRTSNYFGYFATSVFAFLGLGTQSSVAQEKPLTEQTDLKYLNKVTDSIERFKISGIITWDQKPLPGAYITLKGTNMGTISDDFGKFSLMVKLGETLTFSFLDFKEIDKLIDSKEFICIQMISPNDKKREIINVMGPVGIRKPFFNRVFNKIGNWFR